MPPDAAVLSGTALTPRVLDADCASSVLLFSVGRAYFALPVPPAVQVCSSLTLTPVPGTATAVLGATLVQGQVRTVLHAAAVLPALAPEEADPASSFVIVALPETCFVLGGVRVCGVHAQADLAFVAIPDEGGPVVATGKAARLRPVSGPEGLGEMTRTPDHESVRVGLIDGARLWRAVVTACGGVHG